MGVYTKKFKRTSPNDIAREAELQHASHILGMSPKVIRYTKNSIVMEKINEMCIADKYGENIDDIPSAIKIKIFDILRRLYESLDIEYIDVTPYNFIEMDGRVWIIDFGHARYRGSEADCYLEEIFEEGSLTKWNPEFK